jgi:hypothetical protein
LLTTVVLTVFLSPKRSSQRFADDLFRKAALRGQDPQGKENLPIYLTAGEEV